MRELGFGDLVLCAGTVAASGLVERAAAAADAGFDGLSLFLDDYERARASGLSDADIRQLFDDHGLGVAELDPLLNWMPEAGVGQDVDGQGEGFMRYREADFYRVAEAVGARSINAPLVTGKTFELDAIAEAFAGLCDRAREHGLSVMLEFLPWTQIADVRVAVDVLDRAGRDNGGLMFDTWHHYRGSASIEDVPGSRVFGIQVNDAPAHSSRSLVEETTSHRLIPGEGDIDLVGNLAHLQATGCRAPVGVEIFSSALGELPLGEVVAAIEPASRAVLP
ncbi:sugar phosphate isomerase/epimerase [Myxococcota bacterium]|nr:sugar phosphate isomerase/epimerase [Myxococcota bacterium]